MVVKIQIIFDSVFRKLICYDFAERNAIVEPAFSRRWVIVKIDMCIFLFFCGFLGVNIVISTTKVRYKAT